jgi:DNA-binding response OmpR family regulator
MQPEANTCRSTVAACQEQWILVADDIPGLREMVALDLEQMGYRVLLAANGVDAVKLVQIAAPDLVVLDVKMPRMDGFAALRAVRAFSAVPVVMLGAVGNEDAQVEARRAGADDYVTRPFSQRELLTRIESALLRRVPANPTADRLMGWR